MALASLFFPPFYLTTCRLPGFPIVFVIASIKPPVISFGEMLTNKGIHLVGWKKNARLKQQVNLGMRMSRETSICLLGKLVWEMIQSSKKLWVDLLSVKYAARLNFLHANTKSSDSTTWSSLIHAKNIIKDGFSWHM